MAFVINKSKIQSVFQTKLDTPGPGAYQYKSKIVQQKPAPFNSSSNKISYFDVQQTKYGPGSYNADVVKILKQKKIPISSSFNSKVQRFKTLPLYHPTQQNIKQQFQPQNSENVFRQTKARLKNQDSKSKNKNNYLQNFRKTNKQRKVNSIHNKKQFVRVILSNPNNFQMNTSIYLDKQTVFKTQTGPGKYNIETKNQSKSVISWQKDKLKRFKKQKSKSLTPGPGQYELKKQKDQRNCQSTSSFIFGGVRSFMDQIIYKTNIPMKAKILEFKQVKDRYPGPGQYSPQKLKSQSFYCGDQTFGSCVQRFKQNQVNIPGPGYYKSIGISNNFNNTVKQARRKIFGKDNSLVRKYSQNQIIKPFISQQQNDKKNAEDQRFKNFCTLKERCSSKFGSLGQQERFKDFSNDKKSNFKNKIKTQTPGPGQYQLQKNKKIQEKYNSVFKSELKREIFKIEKEQIQLPFYNIQKQDIGNKVKKIKNNIQNLKKVFIEMVPFNSSAKRFSCENQEQQKNRLKFQYSINLKQQNQKYKKLEASKTNNTFANRSTSTHYNKVKKTTGQNCSSSFKSNSNRETFISKSLNSLGPGSYDNATSLDKKSFNSQYNEQLVQRMNIYGQPRSRTSLK